MQEEEELYLAQRLAARRQRRQRMEQASSLRRLQQEPPQSLPSVRSVMETLPRPTNQTPVPLPAEISRDQPPSKNPATPIPTADVQKELDQHRPVNTANDTLFAPTSPSLDGNKTATPKTAAAADGGFCKGKDTAKSNEDDSKRTDRDSKEPSHAVGLSQCHTEDEKIKAKALVESPTRILELPALKDKVKEDSSVGGNSTCASTQASVNTKAPNEQSLFEDDTPTTESHENKSKKALKDDSRRPGAVRVFGMEVVDATGIREQS